MAAGAYVEMIAVGRNGEKVMGCSAARIEF
jgi:hypothetical protein